MKPDPSETCTRTNGFAVASLVCGLLFFTGAGLAALPLGIYARLQISREPERYTGKALANAGIAIGAIQIVGMALVVALFVGSIVTCNGGAWPDGCQ